MGRRIDAVRRLHRKAQVTGLIADRGLGLLLAFGRSSSTARAPDAVFTVGGDGGAKVCVVPLIAMVAERSGRGCLMTLRIAS